MLAFLIRRFLGVFPTLFALSLLSFFLINLAPGDPVITMLGESAAWQQIEKVREELGLTRPLFIRYIDWFKGILHGDLGRSLVFSDNIASLFVTRFPRTAWLALFAFLMVLCIGVPLGVLAGLNPEGMVDRLVMAISALFMATPIFLTALFLMWFFAVKFGFFPVAGYVSPTENFWGALRSLFLPALAISTMYIAYVARMTRAAVVETATCDFVRTAQAKGLGLFRLVMLHILKPSLIPVVTASGLVLAELIIGTVISETIFVIPGIGRLMYDAAVKKDFYVLQFLLLFAGSVYYLVNLIVDLLMPVLDPRIRES